MPTDTSKTRDDILQSAMADFLAHGFAGASLRRIAAGAGVTTGALYRHFADKDALFEALVAPTCEAFLERYQAAGDEHFEQLQTIGIDRMWETSRNTMQVFIEYIYGRFDVFKLLISGSEQSPYENFTHTLIDLDVEMTLKYFDMARSLGYRVRPVDREELHILINAQFSCLFEMVLHELPRQDALRISGNVSRFFAAGWQSQRME